MFSGKIVSAGTNGEVVQWQAFFFSAPSPFPTPAASPRRESTLTSGSLVGMVNARRNRKENALQDNFRDPRAPRLRKVGNYPPTGDGRPGGVDTFEMDYQTSLAREDHGSFSLSGFVPLGSGSGTTAGEGVKRATAEAGIGLDVGKGGGGSGELGTVAEYGGATEAGVDGAQGKQYKW